MMGKKSGKGEETARKGQSTIMVGVSFDSDA